MAGLNSWTCWAVGLLFSLAGGGCGSKAPSVVVYSSVDDEFVRPVAENFQKATGESGIPPTGRPAGRAFPGLPQRMG